MKRLFVGVLCCVLLAAAQAEEATPAEQQAAAEAAQTGAPPETAAAPAPLQVLPQRHGYAFERPQILLRQRLFGLAHGLSLLAAACLDLPEHSLATQDAYAEWHAGQRRAIAALVQDLTRYYFGARAAEARWQDLARALQLNDSIQPALGQVSLEDACASLPEAIVRPRYELDKLLAAGAAPVPATKAPSAVPAPAESPAADPGEPKPAQ